MKTEDIKKVIIEVVEEIQRRSGRPLLGIDAMTRPMQDLTGFDSINAVEASTQLSVQLGCFIRPDAALFQRGRAARSISEITEDVCAIIEKQVEKP